MKKIIYLKIALLTIFATLLFNVRTVEAQTYPTWNITVVPVCPSGMVQIQPLRMFRIIWPQMNQGPNDFDCVNDNSSTSKHSETITPKNIISNMQGIYVGLENPIRDGKNANCSEGVSIEPSSITPVVTVIRQGNSPPTGDFVNFAQYMDPYNWMVRWDWNRLTGGNYTINFNLPVSMCEAPPPILARPALCQSAVIKIGGVVIPNGTTGTVNPGQSLTITSTANVNVKGFSYAFYNLDNLATPPANDPNGIFPKGICFASPGTAAAGTCPRDSIHYQKYISVSPNRLNNTLTVDYNELNQNDLTPIAVGTLGKPTRIQVNAFFTDAVSGNTSEANAACVVKFNLPPISVVPNCTNLTGPSSLTVGQKGTFSADFTSPQGQLRGGVGVGQNGKFVWVPPDSGHFFGSTVNSGSYSFDWTPTAAGTYDVLCRAWNYSRAECLGKANYVDGPPRYLCAGPNASKTVTVIAGTSCSKKAQGDASCDGIVNGADYSFWLNRQCTTGCTTTNLVADFNGDNRVDDDDYLIWFNNSR